MKARIRNLPAEPADHHNLTRSDGSLISASVVAPYLIHC